MPGLMTRSFALLQFRQRMRKCVAFTFTGPDLMTIPGMRTSLPMLLDCEQWT